MTLFAKVLILFVIVCLPEIRTELGEPEVSRDNEKTVTNSRNTSTICHFHISESSRKSVLKLMQNSKTNVIKLNVWIKSVNDTMTLMNKNRLPTDMLWVNELGRTLYSLMLETTRYMPSLISYIPDATLTAGFRDVNIVVSEENEGCLLSKNNTMDHAIFDILLFQLYSISDVKTNYQFCHTHNLALNCCRIFPGDKSIRTCSYYSSPVSHVSFIIDITITFFFFYFLIPVMVNNLIRFKEEYNYPISSSPMALSYIIYVIFIKGAGPVKTPVRKLLIVTFVYVILLPVRNIDLSPWTISQYVLLVCWTLIFFVLNFDIDGVLSAFQNENSLLEIITFPFNIQLLEAIVIVIVKCLSTLLKWNSTTQYELLNVSDESLLTIDCRHGNDGNDRDDGDNRDDRNDEDDRNDGNNRNDEDNRDNKDDRNNRNNEDDRDNGDDEDDRDNKDDRNNRNNEDDRDNGDDEDDRDNRDDRNNRNNEDVRDNRDDRNNRNNEDDRDNGDDEDDRDNRDDRNNRNNEDDRDNENHGELLEYLRWIRTTDTYGYESWKRGIYIFFLIFLYLISFPLLLFSMSLSLIYSCTLVFYKQKAKKCERLFRSIFGLSALCVLTLSFMYFFHFTMAFTIGVFLNGETYINYFLPLSTILFYSWTNWKSSVETKYLVLSTSIYEVCKDSTPAVQSTALANSEEELTAFFFIKLNSDGEPMIPTDLYYLVRSMLLPYHRVLFHYFIGIFIVTVFAYFLYIMMSLSDDSGVTSTVQIIGSMTATALPIIFNLIWKHSSDEQKKANAIALKSKLKRVLTICSSNENTENNGEIKVKLTLRLEPKETWGQPPNLRMFRSWLFHYGEVFKEFNSASAQHYFRSRRLEDWSDGF